MKIPINRQSSQPIYLQIRDRIHHLIDTGHFQPHSQLPSIRKLAQHVQVNKLTVIEAYGVLEAEGLVCARQGAGYFVSPQRPSPISHRRQFNPEQTVLLPKPGRHTFPDIYYAALNSHGKKDYVDFSLGFPQPYGTEDLQRIARRAMKDCDSFFEQGDPQGDPFFRQQIAQLLIQQGLDIDPAALMITSGSMQSLALIADEYLTAGDWVIVEAPTYHGFLSVLQHRGAQVIGIPMTAEGMNLTLLAQYLESHQPKLIYTISTLHNPTGITTTVEHRRALLALAQEFDCLVVEDNAYEPLSFEPTPPPIKAFDTSDHVIYVGTFSKSLMPGLRVGYMAVGDRHRRQLIERKLLHDFHISNASQAIVKEYLASGHYRRRLKQLRLMHAERRDHTLALLEAHFPEETSWTIPSGGTFLWIQLPEWMSVAEISEAAAMQKVLVGAGTAFFPVEQGYPALRLNFSLPPKDSQRGIEILGSILHSATAQR